MSEVGIHAAHDTTMTRVMHSLHVAIKTATCGGIHPLSQTILKPTSALHMRWHPTKNRRTIFPRRVPSATKVDTGRGTCDPRVRGVLQLLNL